LQVHRLGFRRHRVLEHGEGEIDVLAAAPIPEPQTYALFPAGLAALGFIARRQRRRS
jgi:hypothetical protein